MFAYSTRRAAMTVVVLAAVVIAICGSNIVHAQDGDQSETDERLLACDGIGDPAEKMACFDAIVKSLKQSDAAPTADPTADKAPVSDTPALAAPAAAVGATADVAPPAAAEPEREHLAERVRRAAEVAHLRRVG